MAGSLEITGEQNLRLQCLALANQSMGMNGADKAAVLEKAEAYADFVINGAPEKVQAEGVNTDAPVS
jgi:hypothetical protein